MGATNIFRTLGFFLVLTSIISASASASTSELNGPPEDSLRSYLSKAMALASSLESTADPDKLTEFKKTLQGFKESAAFLFKCSEDRRIYNYSSVNGTIYLNVPSRTAEPVVSWPRPNMCIGYVYGVNSAQSPPIGLVLYFREAGQHFERRPNIIATAKIPFSRTFSRCSDHDLRNILLRHVHGIQSSNEEQSEFYDERASLEVRQFLYHASNLETFFTLGQMPPKYSEKLTAYQTIMRSLFELLNINLEITIIKPGSLTTAEQCKDSWQIWQTDLACCLIMASVESKVKDELSALSQFNPYNTRL